MKRSMWSLFLLPVILILTSCGGGEGGSDPNGDTLLPPANLQAIAGDGVVSLSWDAVESATSYKIYLATESGITKINYATLAGGAVLIGQKSPALVSSLSNDVTYYFIVTAVKGGEPDDESSESAEVQAKPVSDGKTSVLTAAPSSITDVSANLNGSFTNPAGFTTTAWFEYGVSTAYGASTPQVAYAAVGLIPVTAAVSSLPQRATLHYRLVTQNSAGVFVGEDQSFTTLATPEVLVADLDAPAGLPSDGSHLYWFEIYGGKLRRADLTTGAVSTLASVVTFGNNSCIAIDANYVYFTASGAIMRANLDGSNLNTNFSLTQDTTLILPHSTGIYIRHQDPVDGKYKISRLSLDGATKIDLFTRTQIGSEGFGGDIVVDDTNLYWSDYFAGTIQRIPLAGGAPVTLALGLDHPFDLLLDGATLYVASADGIKKLPTTGGGLVDLFSTGTGMMTKDGNTLYLASNGMRRIDLLTGVSTPLIGDAAIDFSPVVTPDHLYWITSGSRYTSYGTLARIEKF